MAYSAFFRGLTGYSPYAFQESIGGREGSEGNTMMTRMVDVVVAGPDGTPGKYTVNAVSGDMFKHILVEHLTGEAKTMNLALSEGCRIGNPNRIQYDWGVCRVLCKRGS